MTTELAANNPAQETLPSTSQALEQLAKRANEAHVKVGSAARQGLVWAHESGQALLESNRICPPGQWFTWLAANFKASRWTARRYMDFATECNQLGGLDGATLHRLTPHEAGCALKKLLVLPSGKKKSKKDRSRQPGLPPPPSPAAPGETAVSAPPAAQAQTCERPPATCHGPSVDPFPRFAQLLQELLAGLEAVMKGDDCHDGPFAELLLMDLKTPYADLLDYLAERDELKRISAKSRT